jgi:hypothetical protein
MLKYQRTPLTTVCMTDNYEFIMLIFCCCCAAIINADIPSVELFDAIAKLQGIFDCTGRICPGVKWVLGAADAS